MRVGSRGRELDRGSQDGGAETRGNLGVPVGHAAPGARMVRAGRSRLEAHRDEEKDVSAI